jgi:hypothetical protein
MRRSRVTWVLVLAGLLACAFAQAGDKDAKFYQKQFDRWSKVIANLKAADVTEQAGQDIEVIRTWISQAQAFVASDKLDEIEPLIRRIEGQAEYVRAKINRLAAEDSAEEAEQLAKVAEQEAIAAKDAATTAKKKMEELEAKGL